jgi:hypothetical protein
MLECLSVPGGTGTPCSATQSGSRRLITLAGEAETVWLPSQPDPAVKLPGSGGCPRKPLTSAGAGGATELGGTTRRGQQTVT